MRLGLFSGENLKVCGCHARWLLTYTRLGMAVSLYGSDLSRLIRSDPAFNPCQRFSETHQLSFKEGEHEPMQG